MCLCLYIYIYMKEIILMKWHILMSGGQALFDKHLSSLFFLGRLHSAPCDFPKYHFATLLQSESVNFYLRFRLSCGASGHMPSFGEVS